MASSNAIKPESKLQLSPFSFTEPGFLASPSAFRPLAKICPVPVSRMPPARTSLPPVTAFSASCDAKENSDIFSLPPATVIRFLMSHFSAMPVSPPSKEAVPRKPSIEALRNSSPLPVFFRVGVAL